MLGERLASMLDYNLSQLCGPKCTELKVRDAMNRFTWDPRFLLQQIVHVYLNLSSEKFAQYIANDEVVISVLFLGCCCVLGVFLIIEHSVFSNVIFFFMSLVIYSVSKTYTYVDVDVFL